MRTDPDSTHAEAVGRDRTSVYVNPLSYEHITGAWHPEAPGRIDAALEGVRRAGLESRLVRSQPSHSDTMRIIEKVHSPDYVRALDYACRVGQPLFHSVDNPISERTLDAARACVDTALTAAEALWVAQSIDHAFVIVRPPGHHAEKERAMGFCFFNSIACLGEWLLERDEISRVFILDWDVHHGNGTQHLFEQREDVFYFSVHQFPFFPGTGRRDEIGSGSGRGTTRNIPLDPGANDSIYLGLFEKEILPAIDDYRPDAILVSAGFDAHRLDPVGGMNVTEEGFAVMTSMTLDAARRHAGGRFLSILEGGYSEEGLAESVRTHVETLASD